MTPAEIIAECVEKHYNRKFHDTALCILADLKRAGYELVELPDPHPIHVIGINMHPEYDDPDDDGGPVLQVRFSDAPKPGRLFDRRALAAALLAAARVAEGAEK